MKEEPVEITKTLMFWEEGSRTMSTENKGLYKLEMSKGDEASQVDKIQHMCTKVCLREAKREGEGIKPGSQIIK